MVSMAIRAPVDLEALEATVVLGLKRTRAQLQSQTVIAVQSTITRITAARAHLQGRMVDLVCARTSLYTAVGLDEMDMARFGS